MSKHVKLLVSLVCIVIALFLLLRFVPQDSDQKEVVPLTNNEPISGVVIQETAFLGTVSQKVIALDVGMPHFLYHSGMQQFAEILLSDNIQLVFHLFPNWRESTKAFTDPSQLDIDILLAPLDLIDRESIVEYSPQESLIPYFDTLFIPFLETEDVLFVPYALDPLVTYINKRVYLPQQFALSDLVSFVFLRQQQKNLSMPISWGVDEQDETLLSKGFETYPNYSLITQLLYQHNKGIDQLENISSLNKRSFQDFKQVEQLIKKRDLHCSDYPALCLLLYGFVDVKFGLFSDKLVAQDIFSELDFDQINEIDFPIDDGKSPTRVWGWFLLDDQKEDAIDTFMHEYLKAMMIDDIGLWNDLIRPINITDEYTIIVQ